MRNSIALYSAALIAAISIPAQCAPRAMSTRVSAPHLVSRTTAPSSWVTLKASTNQARYTPGQPIHVTLTATNTFKRDVFLRFSSGQRFDFSVYRIGRKDSVYTWSASRMFPQMVGSLHLAPGLRQTFIETIGSEMGQLKPGKYRLAAHLTNSPRNIIAPPITFEVTDPAASITARARKPVAKWENR